MSISENIENYFRTTEYNTVVRNDVYTYTEMVKSISQEEKKLKIRDINLALLENNGYNEKLEEELKRVKEEITHNEVATISPVLKTVKLDRHTVKLNYNVTTGFQEDMVVKDSIHRVQNEMREILNKELDNVKIVNISMDSDLIKEISRFVRKYREYDMYAKYIPDNYSVDDYYKTELLGPYEILLVERGKFLFSFDRSYEQAIYTSYNSFEVISGFYLKLVDKSSSLLLKLN